MRVTVAEYARAKNEVHKEALHEVCGTDVTNPKPRDLTYPSLLRTPCHMLQGVSRYPLPGPEGVTVTPW